MPVWTLIPYEFQNRAKTISVIYGELRKTSIHELGEFFFRLAHSVNKNTVTLVNCHQFIERLSSQRCWFSSLYCYGVWSLVSVSLSWHCRTIAQDGVDRTLSLQWGSRLELIFRMPCCDRGRIRTSGQACCPSWCISSHRDGTSLIQAIGICHSFQGPVTR